MKTAQEWVDELIPESLKGLEGVMLEVKNVTNMVESAIQQDRKDRMGIDGLGTLSKEDFTEIREMVEKYIWLVNIPHTSNFNIFADRLKKCLDHIDVMSYILSDCVTMGDDRGRAEIIRKARESGKADMKRRCMNVLRELRPGCVNSGERIVVDIALSQMEELDNG